MAIHFKRTTRHRSDESDSIDGGQQMPHGRYLGFCLGPDSDHDVVLVQAGGDTFTIGPGAVVPIAPFEGQPTIECVRTFDIANWPAPAVAHVIGLECPEELATKPRRSPVRRYYNLNLAGLPGTIRVPIAGRRHVMVHMMLGQDGALILRGADDRYGNRAELLASTAIVAGGDGTTYHVGGTDHEELWPTLEIEIGTSTGGTIVVYATGEIGG